VEENKVPGRLLGIFPLAEPRQVHSLHELFLSLDELLQRDIFSMLPHGLLKLFAASLQF
jgi:hypothetical protein